MLRALAITAAVATALSLFAGCDDEPTGGGLLTAVAAADAFVAPETSLVLTGSGSTAPDNDIVSYEWLLDTSQFASGAYAFVPVSTGDTTVLSPFDFGDYSYVLRVTDGEGNTAVDTATVTVSWFYSPQGGEVFQVGDSIRLYLFPVDEQLDVRLLIERGGDQLVIQPPGATNFFIGFLEPYHAYYIPDSVYDIVGWVPLVSDSCKMQVTRYNTSVSCVTRGYFSIIP